MATFKALIRKAQGAADSTAVLAGLTTDGSEVGPDSAAPGSYESVYVTVTANWEVDTVPTLTASIAEASLTVGDTATLTTNASGGASTSYLWKADGSAAPGTNNAATYDTSSLSGGESLTCDVTDGSQSVTTTGVTVSASFTETGVVLSGTEYMTANAALPANAKSMLIFASVIPTNENRAVLASWNAAAGGFYSSYATLDAATGAYIDMRDNNNNRLWTWNETFALSTRYHLLFSVWHDGTNIRSSAFAYISGAWQALWEDLVESGAGGSLLAINQQTLRLFARSDSGSNHQFTGTSFAQMGWTDTAATEIVDVTDPAVRNNFINGASIANPADIHSYVAGQAPTATLQYSFTGDAADANASPVTQSGSPALTLTPSGTFA